jgi:hypothetical protein
VHADHFGGAIRTTGQPPAGTLALVHLPVGLQFEVALETVGRPSRCRTRTSRSSPTWRGRSTTMPAKRCTASSPPWNARRGQFRVTKEQARLFLAQQKARAGVA